MKLQLIATTFLVGAATVAAAAGATSRDEAIGDEAMGNEAMGSAIILAQANIPPTGATRIWPWPQLIWPRKSA